MKNYVQSGNTVPEVAPSGGVVSGQGYVIGTLFGVAQGTAAEGEAFELLIEGVVDLAKEAPLVISFGDRVYWDATPGNVNKTSAAQQAAGVCVADAASADTTCRVKLGSLVPIAT